MQKYLIGPQKLEIELPGFWPDAPLCRMLELWDRDSDGNIVIFPFTPIRWIEPKNTLEEAQALQIRKLAIDNLSRNEESSMC